MFIFCDEIVKEKINVLKGILYRKQRLGAVGVTSTKELSSEYWRTKMMIEEESMGLWRKQQRQP